MSSTIGAISSEAYAVNKVPTQLTTPQDNTLPNNYYAAEVYEATATNQGLMLTILLITGSQTQIQSLSPNQDYLFVTPSMLNAFSTILTLSNALKINPSPFNTLIGKLTASQFQDITYNNLISSPPNPELFAATLQAATNEQLTGLLNSALPNSDNILSFSDNYYLLQGLSSVTTDTLQALITKIAGTPDALSLLVNDITALSASPSMATNALKVMSSLLTTLNQSQLQSLSPNLFSNATTIQSMFQLIGSNLAGFNSLVANLTNTQLNNVLSSLSMLPRNAQLATEFLATLTAMSVQQINSLEKNTLAIDLSSPTSPLVQALNALTSPTQATKFNAIIQNLSVNNLNSLMGNTASTPTLIASTLGVMSVAEIQQLNGQLFDHPSTTMLQALNLLAATPQNANVLVTIINNSFSNSGFINLVHNLTPANHFTNLIQGEINAQKPKIIAMALKNGNQAQIQNLNASTLSNNAVQTAVGLLQGTNLTNFMNTLTSTQQNALLSTLPGGPYTYNNGQFSNSGGPIANPNSIFPTNNMDALSIQKKVDTLPVFNAQKQNHILNNQYPGSSNINHGVHYPEQQKTMPIPEVPAGGHKF